MRFTPTEIATIKKLRGSKVPWPVIAKKLKATILECRTAINLPTYSTPDRQALPWDVEQQTLPFDNKKAATKGIATASLLNQHTQPIFQIGSTLVGSTTQ